jgi:hypothetical protein
MPLTFAKLAFGIALGAALGYGYHRLVGCSTGACVITARWWTSTLYGAFVGGMMSYN